MNTGPAGNKTGHSKATDEVRRGPGGVVGPADDHGAEPGDEILRAIGELQSGLGGLKALQEQTVKLGEELAKKRAAMAAEHARLAALRQEVAAEREAVEGLKKELAAAQAELAERQGQIEEAAEKLAALRKELEAGKAEVAAAREELKAERARLEAMRADGKGGRTREADAKLAAAEARVAELNGQVARLTKQLDNETAALNAKLSETAAERASLEARIASLEQELAAARAGGGGGQGGLEEVARQAGLAADMLTWNSRRQERLRRYRTLLQVEARKLVTAKEALSKRQAECEAMLAQRAKLNQALEGVKALERKLESRRARTGAAATVFLVMGTIAVILAMAWQVTSHVRPATYLASALLEPDGRGLTLGEAEIKYWQNYHIELARDPRMIEVASERFRQRGIISLGSAPELRARLNQDMSVQAQPDGGVLIELRGKGAEKTARELDTFVTAMASVANASREGRADGAATVVSRAAEAGSEPVADDRLVFAAGAAGGGLVGSLLLGVVVWARLSRAKKQYESEQIAAQIDDAVWDGPGAGPVIRKAGGPRKARA